MSISAELRATARSAYRQLFRAASVTFLGDDRVLNAFRLKMRTDALSAQSETNPSAYDAHATLAREAASFLRKNIVQASRAPGTLSDIHEETWQLRITKDTELGSNDSVKSPPSVESNRRIRRKEKGHQSCCSS